MLVTYRIYRGIYLRTGHTGRVCDDARDSYYFPNASHTHTRSGGQRTCTGKKSTMNPTHTHIYNSICILLRLLLLYYRVCVKCIKRINGCVFTAHTLITNARVYNKRIILCRCIFQTNPADEEKRRRQTTAGNVHIHIRGENIIFNFSTRPKFT